jgi:hypothetical protein
VAITHVDDRSMVERKFTVITKTLMILHPSKCTHFSLDNLDEDRLSDDMYSYVFPLYRLYV